MIMDEGIREKVVIAFIKKKNAESTAPEMVQPCVKNKTSLSKDER